MDEDKLIRLHKYIAAQGAASRRAAEALIAAGRVQVNGRVADAMGLKIDPERDRVSVDGVLLNRRPERRYILLHKPAGYISSAHDERGRRTVLDLLHGVSERVYPVGRLDYDSSGLLILTNDGELTHHLLHPSHQVDKTYLALVENCPAPSALDMLRRGIRLEDGITAPAKVRLIRHRGPGALVEISIHEGRNHQVKRMLEAVGHPVKHLKRIRIAFLDAKQLPLGEWRELSADEVHRLKQL